MTVLPVINCPDINCIKQKFEVLKSFLPEGELVHLDVADGSLSPHVTWNEPLQWASIKSPFPFEVHLMMEHPEEHADDWLAAGAQRLIVHMETVTPESLHEIRSGAERYKATVMLSSNPATPIEDMAPYIARATEFQVLAVMPGPAGQEFLPFVDERVRFIREEAPNAIIEVDGGINPETAVKVKVVGADIIVSATYIFNSPDPKQAYEALENV